MKVLNIIIEKKPNSDELNFFLIPSEDGLATPEETMVADALKKATATLLNNIKDIVSGKLKAFIPVTGKDIPIYVVTWENDGDFPEQEIALVTHDEETAITKLNEKPDEYALSFVAKWVAGKKYRSYLKED